MTLVPDRKSPRWLLPNPEPRLEDRGFNKKSFTGWLGRASLLNLEGWVDNPRIDIPMEKWKEEHAGRTPDNEALLDIMIDISVNDPTESAKEEDEDGDTESRRSRRNRLVQLADSIRLNGVRLPLVVTHDKRILDGNRRYFANLYLYRLTDDEDEREKISSLPVWVLPRGVSRIDEDRILTELNSINDCYLQWPYSVKARRVYKDFKDGKTIEELANKYHDWSKSRIQTVINASRIAEEFIEYHDDDLHAKDVAYRKLIWFDELQRSNRKAMEKEPFRSAIFELILKEKPPFSSARDFLRLGEIYDNPEAWEVLTTHEGKEALRQAQFIVERERYEGKSDAETLMKRVNTLLKEVIAGPGFGQVDSTRLTEFHIMAAEVPMEEKARAQVSIELLNGLTSKEISKLPEDFLRDLASVLGRVQKQAVSYQEK